MRLGKSCTARRTANFVADPSTDSALDDGLSRHVVKLILTLFPRSNIPIVTAFHIEYDSWLTAYKTDG